MENQKFSSLSLRSELRQVLQELEFNEMKPIQAEALPLLFQGQDLIGQSKTGSGKTLAFSLPILNHIRVAQNEEGQLQALILCPTRELTAQVVREIRRFGRKIEGLQVLSLTGGTSGRDQAQALNRGVHIVVGTPGRVLDHLKRERLETADIRTLVLDEADKMLEMGFQKEISAIFELMPAKRQTVLFSATFPEGIEKISKQYQTSPRKVIIEDKALVPHQIHQIVYELGTDDKKNILMRVLKQHPADSILIFCNTKAAVAKLVDCFADLHVPCGELHGDLDQRQRDQSLAMFRNGSFKILVATNVAARGIDIHQLDLVINYDFPLEPEDYVHRIGRTGRADEQGTAITFVGPSEKFKIYEIEKHVKLTFDRPTLGFKNQHGLPSDFGITKMKTLIIQGGRKDKLRPGDLLGALTGEGGLTGDQVGKIEIHDHVTYAGISSQLSKTQIQKILQLKYKGRKCLSRVV